MLYNAGMRFRIKRASRVDIYRKREYPNLRAPAAPCEGAEFMGWQIEECADSFYEHTPLYEVEIADLAALVRLARRVEADLLVGADCKITIYDSYME
jgi:hypothetical protein